jgi:type VI secretion system secreted protein Hcp
MNSLRNLLAVAILAIGVSTARADLFLLVDGIPGESTQAQHENWIDVENYKINFANTSTSGGGGAGRSRLTQFDVSAFVSKASPRLLLAVLSGQHIRDMELDITRNIAGTQQSYANWLFNDVTVTNFNQSNNGGPSERSLDIYSFDFQKLEHEYTEFKPDGSQSGVTKVTWNFQTNSQSVATTGIVNNFEFVTGSLAVPEPATIGLGLTGLTSIALIGVRRRRAASNTC